MSLRSLILLRSAPPRSAPPRSAPRCSVAAENRLLRRGREEETSARTRARRVRGRKPRPGSRRAVFPAQAKPAWSIMCIYIYIYICICICREREREKDAYISLYLSLSMYIYIYIYITSGAGRASAAPCWTWSSR